MNNVTQLKAQMAALAAKFIERTRGETVSIGTLIGRLESGDQAAMEELGYLAHRIHGGGATFGFDAVGEHAGKIERLIEPGVRTGTIPDGGTLGQMKTCAAELEQAVQAALASVAGK